MRVEEGWRFDSLLDGLVDDGEDEDLMSACTQSSITWDEGHHS